MKNAWIIFIIYLLIKVSVITLNKQKSYQFNKSAYSSHTIKKHEKPEWFDDMVIKLNKNLDKRDK